MKPHILLLSGLDTMLILLITLVLALGAVNYDKNKGASEFSYTSPTQYETSSPNDIATYPAHYVAIIIDKKSIEFIEVQEGKKLNEKKFDVDTLEELPISAYNREKIPFIIYDPHNSQFFGSVIRFLTDKQAHYGIARISTESTSHGY